MDTVVDRIFTVALQIQAAADTARQNKKDCIYVKNSTDTLHKTVQQYETNVKLVRNAAVQSALKGAKTVLDEALRLVTDCQDGRNIVRVLFGAGEMSNQLRTVEVRIMSVTTSVTSAVQSYVVMKLAKPWYRRWFTRVGEAVTRSLSRKITEVAVEIKVTTETTEMVHQNKADLMLIEKRASSVKDLMPLLENYMNLVNQEMMRVALENLLHTFNKAHTLLMSYREIRINIILWLKGKLVNQLRKVLNQMLSDINAVNRIVMHGLTQHQQVRSGRREIER